MVLSETAPVFAPASELVGERFGAALAGSDRAVVCYCDPRHETAARAYFERIGREAVYYVCHEPAFAELERDRGDVLKIIVSSVLDRRLADRCFQHPGLQLFADHLYLPRPGRESPELFAIGTTAAGIAALTPRDVPQPRERLADVLRSPRVREIRLHTSASTAQASARYIARAGVSAKTEIITHEDTVDPRAYAQIARGDIGPGVLPLHAQCVAAGALADIYDERPDELVFADHEYAPLEPLQLARRAAPLRHPLTIASERSPSRLLERWLADGSTHRVSASNSEAAELVARGEADFCITSESAARRHDLAVVHRFGAPMMLFTFGVSITERAMCEYLIAPETVSAVA